MNALLFNPEYIAKYYNCSGRSYEQWKELGHPNILLGFIYAFIGTIYMVLLFPFMVVFIKSDLMKYSCYKIMFFLGIIDCIQIPIGGFYCGYATAIGMVHCMAPTANYIAGGLALTCWFSGSATCMLLAINRCIDLINPQLGQKLFGGKKTLIWLMICVIYFIVTFFFHTTSTFNSNMYAFFFDPFVGTPERNGTVDTEHYPHIGHTIHNITVLIVLIVAYSSLFVHISIQGAKSGNRVMISKVQRQTFIQCTLICTGTFITTVVYVYIQFVPTPPWVAVWVELAWQLSHGAPGISYALLNKTMKNEFVNVFCLHSRKTPVTELTTKKHKVNTSEHPSTLNY